MATITEAIALPKIKQTDLFIGGQWLPAASGKTFETVNPATEATLSVWSPTMQHGGPPSALLKRSLLRCEPDPAQHFTRVTTEILGRTASTPPFHSPLYTQCGSEAERDLADAVSYRILASLKVCQRHANKQFQAQNQSGTFW